MALHKRGEIWWIDPDSTVDPPVDPSIGSEISMKNTGRPAVVISSNAFDNQSVRIIVPLTSWQDKFEGITFHYRIDADATNKLSNDSSANLLQVRCVSTLRFEHYVGRISADQMEDIISILGLVVDAAF